MLSLISNPVLVHVMHVARTADSSTKQVLALYCVPVHVAMLEFCNDTSKHTCTSSELSLRLSQLCRDDMYDQACRRKPRKLKKNTN